ncbi:uncharacterized protein LY89DRAFT_669830 [Mollisia scopiformis]|uniref:Uncharacterized protein n=1 Tax=Mollisia scopiformis TaxID=149040 RepID=A0A194X938_MOLSC|nr:uncharacterized protein LY89DRAFT_669830 [Mollisia scopiformis]KUJ16302.1 hypothetical protein LY89DRAFT_669830 [Mollisia scopiformis]
MLPCSNISDNICKIGNRCLESLGFKSKPRPKLEISSPFNFKEGPAIHFPGYSEDDISLMREKAIASTAIVEAEDGDLEQFEQYDLSRRDGARSRASSYSCGFGGRVISHARRVSRGRSH